MHIIKTPTILVVGNVLCHLYLQKYLNNNVHPNKILNIKVNMVHVSEQPCT